MFQEHNKLTKTTYWLLAISSIVGLIVLTAFMPQFLHGEPWPIYALTAVVVLMFIINTYLAYLVYVRSVKALQICVWLYGLQIVGFKTENWTFSLAFTVNPTVSIVGLGSTVIVVNLAAIAIFCVIVSAYRSIKDDSKPTAPPA